MNTIKKIWLIIFLLALLPELSFSEGGTREDKSNFLYNNFITSMIFNIEKKISDLSNDIAELRKELDNAPQKKPFYRPDIKDKDDYREKISKETDKLQDYLASTPSGEKTQEINVNDYNMSNKEVSEISNGIKNLNNVIKKYRKELQSNPGDVNLATKYYNTQVECLSALVQMNEEFVLNVDEKYKYNLSRLIDKIERMNKKTLDSIEKLTREEDKLTLKKIAKQQEEAIPAIKNAIETLQKQKQWAKSHLNYLYDKLKVTRIARDTSTLIGDVMTIIQDAQTVLDTLRKSPLPLIVFEVDMSKLNIQ